MKYYIAVKLSKLKHRKKKKKKRKSIAELKRDVGLSSHVYVEHRLEVNFAEITSRDVQK